MLYAARRELQDAADSAALAGAMQVDLGYFARKGRWRIAFDMNLPGARTADEAVQEVCARYGVTCESSVPVVLQTPLDQGDCADRIPYAIHTAPDWPEAVRDNGEVQGDHGAGILTC